VRILLKSAWGADDPTKAAFAFQHANAFVELGHDAQIFLLADAVAVMRDDVANELLPIGWPPLRETLERTFAHRVPIHV
jgi:predicted peroxiredoxin